MLRLRTHLNLDRLSGDVRNHVHCTISVTSSLSDSGFATCPLSMIWRVERSREVVDRGQIAP